MPGHRVVALISVLVSPPPSMMHPHRVIRRDRPVEEIPLRLPRVLLPQFFKDAVLRPKFENLMLALDETGVTDFFKHGFPKVLSSPRRFALLARTNVAGRSAFGMLPTTLVARRIPDESQCVVWQRVGIANQLVTRFQQLWEPMRQDFHSEDFLNGVLKLDVAELPPRPQINDRHAASSLFDALDNWNPAEHGRLADLRQANHRQRSRGGDAAREAVQLRNRFIATGPQIDRSQTAVARFQQPQPTVVPARRMWHRQARADDFVRADVDQHTAASLVRSPAGRRVHRAESRHVLWPPFDQAQAVQVTAVADSQRRNKLRPPHRYETVILIQRAEARKLRVNEEETWI